MTLMSTKRMILPIALMDFTIGQPVVRVPQCRADVEVVWKGVTQALARFDRSLRRSNIRSRPALASAVLSVNMGPLPLLRPSHAD